MNLEGNLGKVLLIAGLGGIVLVIALASCGSASARPDCGDYDLVNGEYVYNDDRGDYEREDGRYIYVGCDTSRSHGSSGSSSGSGGGGFFSFWGGGSRDGSGFRGGGPGWGK
ncbi:MULTISPECIES: hypothetical protein [Nocardiopsis]|uniref:hypothetical protein n=1 Tax=Nocardiopsis TaxID=2013 RepID=UPI000348EDDE|nr:MULTISPECIES: hypothetical protein [Nocardiopsis]